MDKLKYIVCILLTLIFQGCIDHRDNGLEFHKSIKRIKLLNDDYYIKSVRIIAGVPHTKPIQLVDSNFVEFTQIGSRGGNDVSLLKMGEYYSISGTKKPNDLLDEPCLKYIIKLKRAEISKRSSIPDSAIIQFDSDDIIHEVNVFTSNNPKD